MAATSRVYAKSTHSSTVPSKRIKAQSPCGASHVSSELKRSLSCTWSVRSASQRQSTRQQLSLAVQWGCRSPGLEGPWVSLGFRKTGP